ncbi:MAG TPA: hypothetical protein DCS66_14765 [Flavobacteriaceae bacterium]|nr:hypothetical protein [Flavobacteriaceae bacterium]
MIMNAEPDKIHVLFVTTEDSIAVDSGPRDQAFQHFKQMCDVDMVELVRIGSQDAYMLMDENALLRDTPLAVNKIATSLLNTYCMSDEVPSGYLIRGPVMMVGASDDGEIDMDCPRMIYAKTLLLMKIFGLEEDEIEHLLDY